MSGITLLKFHLVSRDPPEVGNTSHRVLELLHLVEVVGHGHGLPYLWLVPHDRVRVRGDVSADWRLGPEIVILLDSGQLQVVRSEECVLMMSCSANQRPA